MSGGRDEQIGEPRGEGANKASGLVAHDDALLLRLWRSESQEGVVERCHASQTGETEYWHMLSVVVVVVVVKASRLDLLEQAVDETHERAHALAAEHHAELVVRLLLDRLLVAVSIEADDSLLLLLLLYL